jgi:ABC-type transport system involved in multi-copper enzyme maturation permease subunit
MSIRFSRSLQAVVQFDFTEVMRSRWLVFSSSLYALLAALFVLVGLRQSTVLGFTGMGRVLLSLCHVLLLLLPLVALTACGQVINRARDDGTFEFLFSQPITRSEYFLAVSLVRFAILLVPLVALFALLAFLGWTIFGQEISWAFLGRSMVICASLLWAFVGFGLAVSVSVRNQAKAVMYLLAIWVMGVALLDFALIGLMLVWRLNPQTVFILASLNPVEAARMALLSSADPTLATLGPVGFYLVNRLGTGLLFVFGATWPAVAGSIAWISGRRQFIQNDLV